MHEDLLYLYSEIPQERAFHHNFRRINVKNTDRFSHTYFQNCMREWNQLDESIKNSPTVSVFKRELNALNQATKKITVDIHDIEEVRLVIRLQVEFSHLHDIKLDIIFSAPVPCALPWIRGQEPNPGAPNLKVVRRTSERRSVFLFFAFFVGEPLIQGTRASARLKLKIMDNFSCIAHATVVLAETSLTVP